MLLGRVLVGIGARRAEQAALAAVVDEDVIPSLWSGVPSSQGAFVEHPSAPTAPGGLVGQEP